MSQNVLVSIIMPVYNGELYLHEALNSIRNQDYSNWQLICVDDESTDSTLEILQKYEKADSRIEVLHQVHARQGAARNLGLKHARGEYIYFMDADDRLAEGALGHMVSIASEDNLDLLLFSSGVFADEDGHEDRVKEYEQYYDRHVNTLTIMTGEQALQHNIKYGFVPSPPLQLCRASLLTDIHFIEHIIFEDNPFSIETYLHARTVGIINEKLYERRIRSGSTMNAAEPDYALNMISYFSVAEFIRQTRNNFDESNPLHASLGDLLYSFSRKFENSLGSLVAQQEALPQSADKLPHFTRSSYDAFVVAQYDFLIEQQQIRHSAISALADENKRLLNSRTYRIGNVLTAMPRAIYHLLRG